MRLNCSICMKTSQHIKSRSDVVLEESDMKVRGVKWTTIEEGDANAHEEGDDDEAETSAEGVNESEPVNSTLWRHTHDMENMSHVITEKM